MLPSAIIFVNSDSSEAVRQYMFNQLHISEMMDGYEFDQRISIDPNYVNDIHLSNKRITISTQRKLLPNPIREHKIGHINNINNNETI